MFDPPHSNQFPSFQTHLNTPGLSVNSLLINDISGSPKLGWLDLTLDGNKVDVGKVITGSGVGSQRVQPTGPSGASWEGNIAVPS